MSKLAIAGVVTASLAALTGSFFLGRNSGYKKAMSEQQKAEAERPRAVNG